MKAAKQELAKGLNEFVGGVIPKDKLTAMMQMPQKAGMGDFAIHCSPFQKVLGFDNPGEAAQFIADNAEFPEYISAESQNGFLNFFINSDYLANQTLDQVIEQGEDYGRNNIGEDKLVVFDYSAPNIGKPLHVGHIRSTILGDSLIKIMQFSGYETFGINYLGDVGLHIAKTVAAYDLWSSPEKLAKNPEEEILNLYVRFNKEMADNPELEEKAKLTAKKIEEGDLATTKTLDFISEMSMDAFNRVYNLLDVQFDEITGQSKFSDKGKEVIQSMLEKGVAEKTEDGAVVVSLDEYKLPEKVVLKSDGTAIYATQDLGAATYRKEHFDFDKLLYVVANEQEQYFKQIFGILDKAGNDWADDCFHVSFGMINLADGKMSTREGTIVYLEEVLDKSTLMAKKVIDEKNPDLENKEDVAKMVGVGAVKYMVLGVDYPKNIEFSWERALNFEGNSAPYIQYAHARASSILRKNGSSAEYEVTHIESDSEKQLVKQLAMFPLRVEAAVEKYKPHIIANYAYELSSAFNAFYNTVSVKDAGDQKETKLALVQSYVTTVNNAMDLLGIQLPEEM